MTDRIAERFDSGFFRSGSFEPQLGQLSLNWQQTWGPEPQKGDHSGGPLWIDEQLLGMLSPGQQQYAKKEREAYSSLIKFAASGLIGATYYGVYEESFHSLMNTAKSLDRGTGPDLSSKIVKDVLRAVIDVVYKEKSLAP